MDSHTKRRLLLGFATNWIGKLAGTIIQLIQVPVFFHFWATAVYGDWLIVTAIPTQLSFSTIGFGNVASNEMTMLVAGGDRDGALRVFQSCWWLDLTCLRGSRAALALVPVLYLRTDCTHTAHPRRLASAADAKWIIFYLGISVLLGQLEHEQLIGCSVHLRPGALRLRLVRQK